MIDRNILLETFKNESGIPGVGADAFPTHLSSVLRPNKVAEFRRRYQAYSLNRKAVSSTLPEWQISDSWKSFTEIQDHMRFYNDCFLPDYYLSEAKRIVSSVLPPVAFIEDDLWPLCTFGPGTFHGAVKGALGSSTHYKIGGAQTVTARARSLSLEVISNFFPNWKENLIASGQVLKVVDGNRPSHVPKDVRKCRPISIEPSLNVFLQQGIGRWMGRHMKMIGFADIHDGQEVNRIKSASLDNGTIDLSNASDTISRALVRYLLPPDWFELLDTVRSHNYVFRGIKGTYENFSSQGNAFTFPLETLIFKAIVMAYTGLKSREVTVYGDDIIVPAEYAPQAVKGLHYAGFTVNMEKSYWGQHDDERKFFRESCGADWYHETLVTPIYYREDVKHDRDLAVLFNRFVEVYPELEQVQAYILSCCRKRPLIGPRYVITDSKSKNQWIQIRLEESVINSISSMYDAYFWNDGLLRGAPLSQRAWFTIDREIPEKSYINSRAAELTFLLKGANIIPRSSKIKVKKVDLTEATNFISRVDVRGIYLSRKRSFSE